MKIEITNTHIVYKQKMGLWQEYHRLDGPASESTDGAKAWWLNGMLHRTDGPAVITSGGDKRYYLNDIRYEPMPLLSHEPGVIIGGVKMKPMRY